MSNFLSSTLPLSFILLSLLPRSTTAFNITKILNDYPDFSTFNSYITQAQVVSEINRQGTITVLVVANSDISPLSGWPNDVLAKILKVHVLLDYFGPRKLRDLSPKTIQTTTLYQRSGVATNKQGYVNIAKSTSGEITFTSAAPGSSSQSRLIQSVTSHPYDISVLQISTPIIPNGIDNQTPPPSPPPPSSNQPPMSSPPTPSKAPSPSRAAVSPPAPNSPSLSPSSPGPAPAAADGSPSDDDKKRKKNSAGAVRACGMWIAALIVCGVWFSV